MEKKESPSIFSNWGFGFGGYWRESIIASGVRENFNIF